MKLYVGQSLFEGHERPSGAGSAHKTSSSDGAMQITIEDRGATLRDRLRDRLEHAGRLRCVEHLQPVIAVTIHGRENGWFDSMWTTCCEALEQQAAAIVKQRC